MEGRLSYCIIELLRTSRATTLASHLLRALFGSNSFYFLGDLGDLVCGVLVVHCRLRDGDSGSQAPGERFSRVEKIEQNSVRYGAVKIICG